MDAGRLIRSRRFKKGDLVRYTTGKALYRVVEELPDDKYNIMDMADKSLRRGVSGKNLIKRDEEPRNLDGYSVVEAAEYAYPEGTMVTLKNAETGNESLGIVRMIAESGAIQCSTFSKAEFWNDTQEYLPDLTKRDGVTSFQPWLIGKNWVWRAKDGSYIVSRYGGGTLLRKAARSRVAIMWSQPPTFEHAAIYQQLQNWCTWSGYQFLPFETAAEVEFIDDPDHKSVHITFYSEKNSYSISAWYDYLGCMYSLRSPVPSEEHTRGGDLSDGDFTIGTWYKIMLDIVSHELLDIAKDVTYNPDWQEAQRIVSKHKDGPGLDELRGTIEGLITASHKWTKDDVDYVVRSRQGVSTPLGTYFIVRTGHRYEIMKDGKPVFKGSGDETADYMTKLQSGKKPPTKRRQNKPKRKKKTTLVTDAWLKKNISKLNLDQICQISALYFGYGYKVTDYDVPGEGDKSYPSDRLVHSMEPLAWGIIKKENDFLEVGGLAAMGQSEASEEYQRMYDVGKSLRKKYGSDSLVALAFHNNINPYYKVVSKKSRQKYHKEQEQEMLDVGLNYGDKVELPYSTIMGVAYVRGVLYKSRKGVPRVRITEGKMQGNPKTVIWDRRFKKAK